jgi:Fe-S cluster biogenesis protein NfuA
MFIQTEETPNPNAIKFLPGMEISIDPIFFNNFDEARAKSSLAAKIYSINDIKAVFFGADFITVTKIDESDWKLLKPEILMVIMDHLVSGLPVFDENKNIFTQANNTEDLPEIEKQIIEIIETRVRPSVAMDGGDIIYKGFREGIVYLQLHGACSGCPSSSITLKNGIESMLQHYVPEVISVEAIEE